MRIPNQIKIAVMTVATVGTVTGSMNPFNNRADSLDKQQEYHRQYKESRRRELEELALRAEREGRSVDAEKYRAAETRLKNEKTGAAVARSIFKKVP